jgi:phosphotransferase system  glucose/maltose/N-acetylglucosamine-specific IIC component
MRGMIEVVVAAGLVLPAWGLFRPLRGRIGALKSAPIFSQFIAFVYVGMFAFFAVLIPVAARGTAGIPIAIVAVVVGAEVGLLIGLQQLSQRNSLVKRLDDRLETSPDVAARMRGMHFGWMIDLTRSRLWRRWF